jgi:L,D-peptidoglycan transpeptidase YkuD (ErfK/YbiS/YcfS/YnhG family)
LAYTRVMTPDNSPTPGHLSRRSLLAAGGAAGLSAVGAAMLGSGRAAAGTGPGVVWSSPPLGAVLRPLPMDLHNIGSSTQVVAVMTPSWSAIHGTIEAWEKDGTGTWHQVLAPVNANIGLNGFVLGSDRIQGDLKTPAGTYRIHKAFGHYNNPGSGIPYGVLKPSYYWAGDQRDPKTYNIFQSSRPSTATWRTSQSEALYYTMPAYQYVACIDFNLAGGIHRQSDGQWVASQPADIRRGSAIFLHCYGETGANGYTLGCANTSLATMQWLLRWFLPTALPTIVMGPSGVIRSL